MLMLDRIQHRFGLLIATRDVRAKRRIVRRIDMGVMPGSHP